MKGNITYSYRVIIEVCPYCKGRKTVDKETLRKYHSEIGINSCIDLLNFIREIVNKGECVCPNCNGEGIIEIWE